MLQSCVCAGQLSCIYTCCEVEIRPRFQHIGGGKESLGELLIGVQLHYISVYTGFHLRVVLASSLYLSCVTLTREGHIVCKSHTNYATQRSWCLKKYIIHFIAHAARLCCPSGLTR